MPHTISAYIKCQDVQHTISRTGWQCRLQVNSQLSQVSLESFAEAGERLCGPTSAGSSFHHCGAKTEKSFDFDDRLLLAHSDGGTRRPAEVVELVEVVELICPTLGCRQGQFH